jgi:hypothetical protein
MDGGEDQVILIEQRHTRLIARSTWRIESEVGQKARSPGGATMALAVVLSMLCDRLNSKSSTPSFTRCSLRPPLKHE